MSWNTQLTLLFWCATPHQCKGLRSPFATMRPSGWKRGNVCQPRDQPRCMSQVDLDHVHDLSAWGNQALQVVFSRDEHERTFCHAGISGTGPWHHGEVGWVFWDVAHHACQFHLKVHRTSVTHDVTREADAQTPDPEVEVNPCNASETSCRCTFAERGAFSNVSPSATVSIPILSKGELQLFPQMGPDPVPELHRGVESIIGRPLCLVAAWRTAWWWQVTILLQRSWHHGASHAVQSISRWSICCMLVPSRSDLSTRLNCCTPSNSTCHLVSVLRTHCLPVARLLSVCWWRVLAFFFAPISNALPVKKKWWSVAFFAILARRLLVDLNNHTFSYFL